MPKTATDPESTEAQVDRLLMCHPPELQAIERALLGLLVKELRGAVVLVDFGWHAGAITVGTGPKAGDRIFALLAERTYVNLWLWDGADLPDPSGIAEGAGVKMRHVKVRGLEQATSKPVRDLIRAQVAAAK